MNYFEFFGMGVCFNVDEEQLKKSFRQNSKSFHPDFHTMESQEVQDEILAKSTYNNEAYKTLSDKHLRLKYILDLHRLLSPENRTDLPFDFLSNMMDINEKLMDLEVNCNEVQISELKEEVESLSSEISEELERLTLQFDDNQGDKNELLGEIKEYYLKNKYLLRIQEKINTFATP